MIIVAAALGSTVDALQAVIVPGQTVASRALSSALASVLESQMTTCVTSIAAEVPATGTTYVFDCGAPADVASDVFLRCVSDDLDLWTRIVFDESEPNYLYNSPSLRSCSVLARECYGVEAPHPFLDAALTGTLKDDDETRYFTHILDAAKFVATLIDDFQCDEHQTYALPGHVVTVEDVKLAAAGTPKKVTYAKGYWPSPWILSRSVFDDLRPKKGDYAIAFNKKETPSTGADDRVKPSADTVKRTTKKKEEAPPDIFDATSADTVAVKEAPKVPVAVKKTKEEAPPKVPVAAKETKEETPPVEILEAPKEVAVPPPPPTEKKDLAKKKEPQPQVSDTERPYDSLKVVDLKEELRLRNLKVSGNKADLIQRLRDDDTDRRLGVM